MQNEIILYSPNELAEHIEVRIDNETVWLSLNQIAQLFCRDKSVISRHLRNVFKDGELVFEATVAKNATVQIESGREVRREIEYYNLDAILSVGYRVNSKQGTQFRIWATSVLRDYLLKGYAINQRMNRIENNVENLAEKVNAISLQIQSSAIPTQGVFFDGQVFDAYELASKIIRSAQRCIVLIDNYIDESTLTLLAKKNKQVKVLLLSKTINKQLALDVKKANEQYGDFEIQEFNKSHDRFLIIDGSEVFHLGASLKDLGKKWFAFSQLNKNSVENILKSITNEKLRITNE
jgi:Virulence protein RhuM family